MLMFSCSWESSTEKKPIKDDEASLVDGVAKTDNATKSIAAEIPSAFTIIPNQQVGLIKITTDENKIKEIYGADNVVRKEIGIGEGESVNGTIVFPEHKNQVTIIWKTGAEYKEVQTIRIDGEASDWKTTNGIKVGTSLEELRAINGFPFLFAGFEWDYAGRCNGWGDGKISPNLVVYLEPENMEAAFPDLLGDKLFSSDLPKAKEAKLKVISFEVNFD